MKEVHESTQSECHPLFDNINAKLYMHCTQADTDDYRIQKIGESIMFF